MYEIGLITTTHGIKGEVKVRNLSDFERFNKGDLVYIIYNKEKINLEIENVRSQAKNLIVKFKEFNNINEVINYKGLIIYSNERAELLENEFYYEDLYDLKVYDNLNNYLGTVNEVMELPHGEVLVVINKESNIRHLIPFVDVFIVCVDDEKIIIRPIEGLL
ncbi:MAG TPA: 16S rRNA processing protein RimM [Acholeplasma sp.]|nr:16S rRNA processing protein RimM [Acholeplasma sp.]